MWSWFQYSLQTKNFSLTLKSYMEVQHSSFQRFTKVKEKWSTIKFNLFIFYFIFFVSMSQTISNINRSDTCYFSHTSNSWYVCWRMRVRSHVSNGEDCTCASLLHKLSSRELCTEYSTSRVKTQSHFKDQSVYRCEVQEMRRLNYFFRNLLQSFFYKNKSLGFDKKLRIS